jgi:hypothetical protein
MTNQHANSGSAQNVNKQASPQATGGMPNKSISVDPASTSQLAALEAEPLNSTEPLIDQYFPPEWTVKQLEAERKELDESKRLAEKLGQDKKVAEINDKLAHLEVVIARRAKWEAHQS